MNNIFNPSNEWSVSLTDIKEFAGYIWGACACLAFIAGMAVIVEYAGPMYQAYEKEQGKKQVVCAQVLISSTIGRAGEPLKASTVGAMMRAMGCD